MALTPSWLKANLNKPRAKRYDKTDRDGLSVRVSTTGKITFQMRYRWNGKPVRFAFAEYPHVSLAEARQRHFDYRAALADGRDPRDIKREAAQAEKTALDNETMVRQWFKKIANHQKSNAKEILRSFEIHAFPKIGKLPAHRTSTNEWLEMLEPLVDERPSIAERLLSNTKQVHRWAQRRQLIETCPLDQIQRTADLNIRRTQSAGRILTWPELWLVWRAIDRSRMAQRSKLFIKLCLFFGCRPIELREAPRDEFDLTRGVWTIPPHRHKVGMKTGRPLVRPIIPSVVPWLEECKALSHNKDMLFSLESRPGPLRGNAIEAFPESAMRNVKRYFREEMEHWSLYDLRKTARTNWSMLTDPHIAELMMGHKLPGDWGTYDFHQYRKGMTQAYQGWWDLLQEIVAAPRREALPDQGEDQEAFVADLLASSQASTSSTR